MRRDIRKAILEQVRQGKDGNTVYLDAAESLGYIFHGGDDDVELEIYQAATFELIDRGEIVIISQGKRVPDLWVLKNHPILKARAYMAARQKGLTAD
jgi:hypothetical protein